MPFGLAGFVARWLAALFLVFATYNPSGYSYCDWVADFGGGHWVLSAFVTIVLVIAYSTFFLATLRSLVLLGVATWALFFGPLVWGMFNSAIFPRRRLRAC